MNRVLPLLLALALSPLQVFGQAAAPPSAKAVQRLNRAPVSKEVLKVKLPRPRKQVLPNGLTLLVVEQRRLPLVQFSLWVKTGALSDPKELPGLAKFTAEMLREGTKTRTSAQLAAEIDELGASLEASAPFGLGLTVLGASGLAEDKEKLLELMADMALNPAFSEEELDKYRKRQLAELEELRSNPQFLGRERFHAALYKESAPARISATAESIKAATAARLKAQHAAAFLPDNAILGVAGDVSLEEILPLVKARFGSWSGKSQPQPAVQLPEPAKRRILLVDRPGSVQTELVAGNLSLTRKSPDFIPLTVANRVLGGGPSARLFLQLREEKGYTYGAYSNFNADIYPGPFSARMAVRTEVTEPALKDLLAEFEKLRAEPVPADELDDSRRSIVAKFALSLESPANLLSSWLTVQYFGLAEDYWDRYAEDIAATDSGKLQAAAKKYVGTDNLQIVAVGDAKTIKAALEKLGPVEVYDVDGKRKDLVDTAQ